MNTRSLYFLAAAGGLVLFAVAMPQPTSGQNSTPPPTVAADSGELSPQLVALINELSAQGKQLASNQAQIDDKVDQLTETIRQARLFAARVGGKK